MAKTYSPKKIEVIFEPTEAPSKVIQARIDEAYDILFEELFGQLKTQDESKKEQNIKETQLLITRKEGLFVPNYQL